MSSTSTVDLEAAFGHEDKLELRAWLRLLTCCNLIESEVRRRLRDAFDTTLPRFDVLAQLERAGELPMSELSQRLMVTGGNVTGMVDRLAAEGLVAKRPCADDRRRQLVRLTAKGRRSLASMAPEHQRWIDEMLGQLSRDELRSLYRLLAKLKTSVTAAAQSETP